MKIRFLNKKNVVYFIIGILVVFSGLSHLTSENKVSAVSNTLKVDANKIKVPYVEPAILGGNDMSNRVWDYNFDLFKELGEAGKNIQSEFNKPWWRIHMADAGLNHDIGMFSKEFYKRENGFFNPMITEDDKQYNWIMQYPLLLPDISYNKGPNGQANENYWQVEWFDSSPTYQNIAGIFNRHSISYTKKPGSSDQKHRLISRETGTPNLGKYDIFYRFDLKLSSEIPFNVAEGAFIVNAPRFRMFVNPDRSLKVFVGADFDQSTLIDKTQILEFDRWYGLEVKVGKTSELWINGVKIAEFVLTDEQVQKMYDEYRSRPELSVGTLTYDGKFHDETLAAQLNDSYKFKLDEVEIRTKYAGNNPKHPLDQSLKKKFIDDVIIAYSFDHSLTTLDDMGVIAEKLNLELVPGLPSPCVKKYGCTEDTLIGKFAKIHSVEGQAAIIQYLVGQADSAFAQKAKELIDADFPVNDLKKYNYANLRASRGRIEPYAMRYVEVGNEPYYAEYNKNPDGFAQFYIDQCRAIKAVKSDLKCIIPGQGDYYDKIIQPIMAKAAGESLISGVGVHDYFLSVKPSGSYYNNRTENFLRSMAGPYADNYQRYQHVKEVSEELLKNEPNFKEFFYLSNEFSTTLWNFKEASPDKYVDAAFFWSELAFLMENGFRGAAVFVWNTTSWGEGMVHGLIGDYSKIPQVNLPGEIYQNFARHFGWGGKILETEYDPLKTYDPISKMDIPLTTAVSSISPDKNHLYISIINRSNQQLDYNLNISNFEVENLGRSYILDADDILNSHNEIHFYPAPFLASPTFQYKLPALSITFIELDRKGYALKIDNDNDGFDIALDCNDRQKSINPGAQSLNGNGIDENCDGADGVHPTRVIKLPDNTNNTGGDTGENTGGDTGENTGGNTGENTGGNTGGNTSGDTGGNTSGDTGGNTSGDTGGNTTGDTGGNTGGDTGGNTGGDTGGNTGGDTGGNTGGDTNPPEVIDLISGGGGSGGSSGGGRAIVVADSGDSQSKSNISESQTPEKPNGLINLFADIFRGKDADQQKIQNDKQAQIPNKTKPKRGVKRYPYAFPDTATHQLNDAIQFAKDQRYIYGYPDRTFRPNNKINRAEFLKILVNANLPGAASGGDCFNDVGNQWFAPYICTAKQFRLISGYENGLFQPDSFINQAEALKIILLAEGIPIKPADENESWYAPYVQKAVEIGLLQRVQIVPERELTRAEMTELIYKLKGDE